MKQYIPLGNVITKSSVERCGDRVFPILSITMKDGLVMQDEKFKKRIASVDTADYKVIPRGKLVQGIHIDEANFGVQDIVDFGIVSPAYKIWDINTNIINPKYLEIIMRSPRSLAYYTSKLNGSVNRRGRMSDEDFLNMPIPYTGLNEQGKILGILNKAKAIIQNRQATLDALDMLIKARFVEMFGDFKTNPMDWPIVSFEEIAIIDGNMTTDYKRYADYPHIGIDSIEKDTGLLKGYRTVAEDGVISGKYIFTPAHIIYSKIRPNLNKVALPDFDGLCSADAYPILPVAGKCNRVFLAYDMRSTFFLDYILQFCNRTNLPKVNRKEVAGFRTPLPPIQLQDQFASFVSQVDKSKSVIQSALTKSQLLFDSLMQKYFG